MASSTRPTFSAMDQRRWRCTEVMTSAQGEGAIGSWWCDFVITRRLLIREP